MVYKIYFISFKEIYEDSNEYYSSGFESAL